MSEFDSDPDVEGVRVTDKRRVDPETGEVRVPPVASAAPEPEAAADPVDEPVDQRVAELTGDLQRVQAEYANYRKRVDRDREAVHDLAAMAVVNELLPILDDIARAKEHGEYEGGLRSLGDSLLAVTTKLGLEPFGEVGEEFDPMHHEALTHTDGADLPAPRVARLFQVGYRFRGRELRPARVGVEE